MEVTQEQRSTTWPFNEQAYILEVQGPFFAKSNPTIRVVEDPHLYLGLTGTISKCNSQLLFALSPTLFSRILYPFCLNTHEFFHKTCINLFLQVDILFGVQLPGQFRYHSQCGRCHKYQSLTKSFLYIDPSNLRSLQIHKSHGISKIVVF